MSGIPSFPGPIERHELLAFAPGESAPPAQLDADPLRRILRFKRKPELLSQEGMFGTQVRYDLGPPLVAEILHESTQLYDDPHNFVTAKRKNRDPAALIRRGKEGVEVPDPIRYNRPNDYQVRDDGFGPGWARHKAALDFGNDPALDAAYTRALKAVGKKWQTKLNSVAARKPHMLSSINSVADLLAAEPDPLNSTALKQGSPTLNEKERDSAPCLNKNAQSLTGSYKKQIIQSKADVKTRVIQKQKKNESPLTEYLPYIAASAVGLYIVYTM